MSYDSTEDTHKHVDSVRKKLYTFMSGLNFRAAAHDKSKFESPEKEVFDEMTPVLKTLIYGSDEYKENLKRLQVALDHHYANNSHHPEHYPEGINGMDLFDIVEMFCDWMAAVERTKDGDIRRSINYNQGRFNMSDQLVNIFHNTLKHYEAKKDNIS